jgi:hypothetical protein
MSKVYKSLIKFKKGNGTMGVVSLFYKKPLP